MRVSRGALVWGLTLILLGVFLFAQQQGMIRVPVPLWAVMFGGLGVLFLLTALTNFALWGMVFPGCILLGLGAVIVLAENNLAPGSVIGAVFLASVALPFWIVAFIRRANWWAMIPAGVVSVLAIMSLLAEGRYPGSVVGGLFFLGLGGTFALVRLWTIGRSGMGWVWYPALILGGLGLVVLASGDAQVWPFALIGVGLVLLVRALIPRRPSSFESSEPEAKG